MESKRRNLVIGYIFTISGILLLLNNLGLFDFYGDFIWGLAFITIGTAFLITYRRSSQKIGLLILGFISLVIGISILIDFFHLLPDELIGTLFLWCFSGIFITIHFKKGEHWWAVIPGGFCFILGIIVLLEAFHLLRDDRLWFVFFFGISWIFWYLLFIKNEQNRLDWAKYPAIIFTIFSLFIMSVTWDSKFTDILFPISIIVLGIYLVKISFSRKDN